jgi:elongation factor P--beta-lysine ligase
VNNHLLAANANESDQGWGERLPRYLFSHRISSYVAPGSRYALIHYPLSQFKMAQISSNMTESYRFLIKHSYYL